MPPAVDGEPPGEPRSKVRATFLGLAIGVGVGVAAVAIVFSIVAIPMVLLASTDGDQELDRDLVRTGLFGIAVPLGALVGVAVGSIVGVWYARGGRLPTDHTPIHG